MQSMPPTILWLCLVANLCGLRWNLIRGGPARYSNHRRDKKILYARQSEAFVTDLTPIRTCMKVIFVDILRRIR